jgi:hypothetical protein
MQILPGNRARSCAAHHLTSAVRSAVTRLLQTHSSHSDAFTSNQYRGTCVFDLS